MPYSPSLIVDYFLTHTKTPLTGLHLIKMTYIAHGYSLAIHNKPLIRARIEAWKHGPMIPVLYHALKQEKNPITELIYSGKTRNTREKEFIESVLDSNTKNLLNQIIRIYGHFTDLELSAITHETGTPWHTCHIPGRVFTPIPDEVLRAYYEGKMAKAKI